MISLQFIYGLRNFRVMQQMIKKNHLLQRVFMSTHKQGIFYTFYDIDGNGTMELIYSGSAAESGVDFYKIGNDGFAPELVDSFAAVTHLERRESVSMKSFKVLQYYLQSVKIDLNLQNVKIKRRTICHRIFCSLG